MPRLGSSEAQKFWIKNKEWANSHNLFMFICHKLSIERQCDIFKPYLWYVKRYSMIIVMPMNWRNVKMALIYPHQLYDVFFKSSLILSPFLYLYILGVIRYDENGNPEPIADTRVRAMEIFAVRNIMTFIIGFSNNNFCYWKRFPTQWYPFSPGTDFILFKWSYIRSHNLNDNMMICP